MDDLRLEGALRHGPPYRVPYVARPLSLGDAPAARGPVARRRVAVVLMTFILLLAIVLAVLAVGRALRPSTPGPLAFLRGDALFVLPGDGGPERRILSGAPDASGGLCPPPNDLVTCGAITRVVGWSADGGLVLGIARDQSGDSGLFGVFDLYAIREDGTGLRLLHRELGDPKTVALSPDGRRIVSTIGELGETGRRMIVVDTDDGETVELPDGINPGWSPDSTLIAYESGTRGGGGYLGDTWLVDPEGQHPKVVAPGYTGRLAWSPDAKAMAFDPHGGGIDILTIDGSVAPWRIDESQVQELAWSPDGQWIAAIEGPRVVLLARDGSDRLVIRQAPNDDARRLSWSRDSRWLVWWELGDDVARAAAYDTSDRRIHTVVSDLSSGFALGPQP